MDGIARFRGQAALQLQAQIAQLALQFGDFLLLPGDGAVQFFEQIFTETQLDLDFREAQFHVGTHAGASTSIRTPRHSTLWPARIFAVLRLSA